MAVRGVGYTAGRLTAAQLRAAHMGFAGRYIGRTTRLPAKFATKEEVADFRDGEVGLVLFFEDGAERALGGAVAGRADAQFAEQQCAALGAPDHPVLFTVDFAATAAQITGPISAYFAAVDQVLGPPRVGGYGSYDTVRILLDRGLVTYACQTPAWSAGRRDQRAQLYQGDPQHNAAEQTTVAGVLCDVLTALVDDYGQRLPAGPTRDEDDMVIVTAPHRPWLAYYPASGAARVIGPGEQTGLEAVHKAAADPAKSVQLSTEDFDAFIHYLDRGVRGAIPGMAAVAGQVAGLTAAVAGGTGVDPAAITAAAEAGTAAALHQALTAGADATEPTP